MAPAERSPGTQHKAQTKRTAQGEAVHSFQTLLLDLATIAKNAIVFNIGGRDADGETTVVRVTKPTPLQQRAFELLDIALK